MKSGHFNIFPILEFVAEHPQIPSRSKGDFRLYAKMVNRLTIAIPKEQGWYLWGKFSENSKWETFYLGKSGKRKTSSLRPRIKEELSNERIAFWAFVYGKKCAFKEHNKLYRGRFDREAKRSLRKVGANFIIWVSDEAANEDDISLEERNLISYYQPIGNIQVVKSKLSPKTKVIVKNINKEIHKLIKI